MIGKFNLDEAIQFGPWRIKRKHLLFTLFFGVAIIVFGVIVLGTHVFERNDDGNEDEEEDEDDDEDSESSFQFGNFTGGDWLMVVIMIAAGAIAMIAIIVCIIAKPNTPRRMSQISRQASIYSVQFNSKELSNKGTSEHQNRASFSAPQQLPVWTGAPLTPVGGVNQPNFIPRIQTSRQTSQSSQASQGSIHKIVLENRPPSAPPQNGGKERPPPYSP